MADREYLCDTSNLQRTIQELFTIFSVILQAFEELEALLARNSICIAIKEKLVKDSGVAHEGAYDDIVQKLLTKPRARGQSYFLFIHYNKQKQLPVSGVARDTVSTCCQERTPLQDHSCLIFSESI